MAVCCSGLWGLTLLRMCIMPAAYQTSQEADATSTCGALVTMHAKVGAVVIRMRMIGASTQDMPVRYRFWLLPSSVWPSWGALALA